MRGVLILLVWMQVGLSLDAFGQKEVNGQVVNAVDGQPLSFVSIGVPGTRYGTISNEDGSFELKLPADLGPLVFSHVGYEHVQVEAADLSDLTQLDVFLTPSTGNLEAVVVSADKVKKKQWRLGNSYGSSAIVLSDSVYAGAEIALKIELKKLDVPLYTQELRFKVRDNTLGEVKARPHFYLVDDKTGKPGREITSRDVVVRSEQVNGWLRVRLPEPLEITEDFYISIEWVFDKDDRKAISRAYHDFKAYHPGLIETRYTFVNGMRVPFEDFGGNLKVGWSVSCATEPGISSRHTAYVRYNSFGSWNISTAVPAVQVELMNRISEVARADESEISAAYQSPPHSYTRMVGYHLEKTPQLSSHLLQKHNSIEYSESSVIEVTTRTDNGRVMINAFNHSSIPQSLTLKLTQLHNLSIVDPLIQRELEPGFNSVASIRITDPRESYHYKLEAESEAVLTTSKSLDTVQLYIPPTAEVVRDEYGLHVSTHLGDTIVTPAKGRWVQHPLSEKQSVIVGDRSNLSFLTSDGYLIVYEGEIKPFAENTKRKSGEALTPVGVAESNDIRVFAYRITKGNQLEQVPIKSSPLGSINQK